MSNFGLSCDVCNRENVGITWVNGMKFCAKCYQETFGETDKDRKIAELQKQLEEKERLLQYGKTEIKKLHKRINDIVKRDEKLFKSQPAEIVEKIKEQLYSKARSITGTSVNCVRLYDIRQILDTILKEHQK